MEHPTVICSTYNNPRFLEIVLDSLTYQSHRDFELIIADDGSTEETKTLIDSFRPKFANDIKHVWHKDKGWQKSQIHNLAIKEATGDLLIFIDGDCVLASNFIADHWSTFQEERSHYVLMGRRVELGEEITKKITKDNYRGSLLSTFSFPLFFSCLSSDSRGFLRKFSFKNPLLKKVFKVHNVKDLLGCNFSLPKDLMYSINGFNEKIERGEDGDIFVRLRNLGVKTIGRKYFAPMFHLWHPRGDYQYVDDAYEELLKRKEYTWANHGITHVAKDAPIGY